MGAVVTEHTGRASDAAAGLASLCFACASKPPQFVVVTVGRTNRVYVLGTMRPANAKTGCWLHYADKALSLAICRLSSLQAVLLQKMV